MASSSFTFTETEIQNYRRGLDVLDEGLEQVTADVKAEIQRLEPIAALGPAISGEFKESELIDTLREEFKKKVYDRKASIEKLLRELKGNESLPIEKLKTTYALIANQYEILSQVRKQEADIYQLLVEAGARQDDALNRQADGIEQLGQETAAYDEQVADYTTKLKASELQQTALNLIVEFRDVVNKKAAELEAQIKAMGLRVEQAKDVKHQVKSPDSSPMTTPEDSRRTSLSLTTSTTSTASSLNSSTKVSNNPHATFNRTQSSRKLVVPASDEEENNLKKCCIIS